MPCPCEPEMVAISQTPNTSPHPPSPAAPRPWNPLPTIRRRVLLRRLLLRRRPVGGRRSSVRSGGGSTFGRRNVFRTERLHIGDQIVELLQAHQPREVAHRVRVALHDL